MKENLVIGGSGLVGSRFVELFKDKYNLVSVDEKTLDITDENAVDDYLKNGSDISAIVNFAAFTDVGAAEKETGSKEGLAWKLNALAPFTFRRIVFFKSAYRFFFRAC